jgi:site-specific recombinase XerD
VIEAGFVRWQDVKLVRGFIKVRGIKTEAAAREVPLCKTARELLECILARLHRAATDSRDGQPYVEPTAPVLVGKELQKSLESACAAVGAERLTHRDLRACIATSCIEAGVDIPTVEAWLGHTDGGRYL